LRFLFLLALSLSSSGALALPLYELGVAAGSGYVPDYPASDEGRVRTLVLPNFRYRGKVIRADEEGGLRARVAQKSRYDFDLSFGGAFPVNAGENRARKDMEPLDWLVEFGARLMITVWDHPGESRLRIGLPLRSVFSANGTNFTRRGFVTVPGLIHEQFAWPCQRCRTLSFFGPTLASEGVADYFYQVEKKDVTPERGEYDARRGLIGTDLTTGLAYTHQSWEVYIGGRVSSYAGAANRASPLFRRETNVAGFIAFGWLFYQSSAEAYSVR